MDFFSSSPPSLYENNGEADFMESLRNLFTSFNDMMNSHSENTGMVKVGWLLHESNTHAVSHTARSICCCVKSKQLYCDLLWAAVSVIRATYLFKSEIVHEQLRSICLLTVFSLAAFLSLRFVTPVQGFLILICFLIVGATHKHLCIKTNLRESQSTRTN